MADEPSIASLFGAPSPPVTPRQASDQERERDPSLAQVLECAIPMRDGVELAADVHLPGASSLPVPAVVHGTPYDKGDPHQAGREARLYRAAGYAGVSYDVRGRGKSEGEWRAFVHDPADGHDVVEWVAAQPWCNGVVGVTGLSYSGWIAWAAASERPAHLRAMISTSPAGRWMQEIPYTNGCFQLYFAYWAAAVRRRIIERGVADLRSLVEVLPVERIGHEIAPSGRTWRDLMDHDTLDDHWRALRWDGDYRRFDVPCLHVTGWHDLEDLEGAFHHYEQMLAGSPAADRQWLVVGPWSHLSCRFPADRYGGVVYGPDAAIDMDGLHLRFFDRFLRGIDNGMESDAPVRVFDTGAGRWRALPSWSGDTREHVLRLRADGGLAATAGAPGGRPLRYDPSDAPGVRFDVSVTPWEPPLDLGQLESHHDVVTWTSAGLAEPLTLRGRAILELHAATDVDDTDWHVKLSDVDEAGRSNRVASGCLRASYRHSLSQPSPLVPGALVAYRIELTPAFHTFAAGHRLRLSLAGSDFPWFARSMNRFGPIGPQSDPRVAGSTISCGGDAPSSLYLTVEA